MIELESIAHLPKPDTYWYVGTPYTKYHGGLQAAYLVARRASVTLGNLGIDHYAPIVWTHPIGKRAGIDLIDHEFWMAADMPYMQRAAGLLVVKLDGWDQSRGIKEERRFFESIRKPIYGIEPGHLIKACECKGHPSEGFHACECGSQVAIRRLPDQPSGSSLVGQRIFAREGDIRQAE